MQSATRILDVILIHYLDPHPILCLSKNKWTQDFLTLAAYEYDLQKVLASILQSIQVVAAAAELIVAAQWI